MIGGKLLFTLKLEFILKAASHKFRDVVRGYHNHLFCARIVTCDDQKAPLFLPLKVNLWEHLEVNSLVAAAWIRIPGLCVWSLENEDLPKGKPSSLSTWVTWEKALSTGVAVRTPLLSRSSCSHVESRLEGAHDQALLCLKAIVAVHGSYSKRRYGRFRHGGGRPEDVVEEPSGAE